MKLLGLIPARGGSKGIPRKNLADLGGRPMMAYTIEAALSARSLTTTAVSTEDSEIASAARACGAKIISRPKVLATDEAQVIDVALDALDQLAADGLRFDAVVLLQATSPFRTAGQIDEAVELFKSSGTDALLSVHRVSEHPCEVVRKENGKIVEAVRRPLRVEGRQHFPDYHYVNGAIYITRTDTLRRKRIFWDENAELYSMPPVHGIDIDDGDQLDAARALLAGHPGLAPLRAEPLSRK